MRLSKVRRDAVTAAVKETVVEAAGSVLEKYGFVGMTMERVAAKAGMAAGSLYNYFRSKHDLVQFVYAQVVEPLFEALEATSKSELPAPEKVRQIVNATRDAALANKAIIRLVSGEEVEHERADMRPRFLQIVAAIFEQGIREGSFRPHNSAHSSRMLLGCLKESFELLKEGASNDEVSQFTDLVIGAVQRELSPRVQKTANSAGADRATMRRS